MYNQKKALTKKQKHSKNNYRIIKKYTFKTNALKYKLQQHGSGPNEDKLKQNSKIGSPTSRRTSRRTSSRTSSRTSRRTVGSKNKENASKTIGKFILKNKDKLRSKYLTTKYLKVICEDSGACISFGREVNKINELFDNFTNFKYAETPIITLGEESANGFVKQIKYVRNDYECYAVLKSSLENYSDNLMYEYEVGVNFINTQNKIFPCFLETYGLYNYKDEHSWSGSMKSNEMEIGELINNLQNLKSIDYTIGCTKSKYIAILIQHVKNAVQLSDFAQNIFSNKTLTLNQKNEILKLNIPPILYQIYMPLVTLFDKFTHYDLHLGNILLYEPVKGSYITYNYYLNSGKTIQFKSSYIVKIIDYGRCYYNNGTQSSFDTYSKLKQIKNCNDLDEIGFGTFSEIKTKIEKNGYDATNYLCSHKSNVSSDLNAAFLVYNFLNNRKTFPPELVDLFKPIEFRGINRTKEREETGLPRKINNIMDFLIKLEDHISNNDTIHANNKQFEFATKLGDFHIYQDGRMMKYNTA
jgi:hypothetical protein